MNVGLLLAVAAGGLVGAPARYLVDQAVSDRVESDLPWGTLVINVSGSLLLGLLTGLVLAHRLPAAVQALAGTGFCGAFTTFSTFTFETVRLIEESQVRAAVVNVAVSIGAGLVAATAGVIVGLAL